MIAVVDYGMGNLRSVANAVLSLGGEVVVSAEPDDLRRAERIILPGVGAFAEAMARLHQLGFVAALREQVLEQGKPFLGLCLGMQLLAERGFEHGEQPGLGLLAGEVRLMTPLDPQLRVPHIGWNSVAARPGSRLFAGLLGEPCFYFVHSYAFVAADADVVAATCDYGGEVVAAVEQGHVFGTQFHPEKSHRAGLQLLKNFLTYTQRTTVEVPAVPSTPAARGAV